jgi:preprotein translocase subunit SecA
VEFHEALKEVLDTASQPKQYPPGVTPIALSGDAIDTQDVKARAWHESLTLSVDSQVDPMVEEAPPPARQRTGRNDPCPCGSGKKFKKCCLNKGRQGGLFD